jgi:predicted transcriptional regulator
MRRKELPKYYNKEKDLIICQLCFKEFRTIQTHITRVHKMDCVEYKKKFKLFNGDLMCLRTRKKMANKPEEFKQYLRDKLPNNIKMGSARGKIKPYIKEIMSEANFVSRCSVKRKENLSAYWKTEEGRLSILKGAEKRKTGTYITCIECGKTKYVKKCFLKTAKFCSRECHANYDFTHSESIGKFVLKQS